MLYDLFTKQLGLVDEGTAVDFRDYNDSTPIEKMQIIYHHIVKPIYDSKFQADPISLNRYRNLSETFLKNPADHLKDIDINDMQQLTDKVKEEFNVEIVVVNGRLKTDKKTNLSKENFTFDKFCDELVKAKEVLNLKQLSSDVIAKVDIEICKDASNA